MSSPKFFSPTNPQSEMLGHIPIAEGNTGHEDEGKGGADQDGSLCGRQEWEPVEPLLLLIQVMQVNGRSLPIGSFTARAIVYIVQRHTGYHPVNVEVMLERDAIIELEPEVRVGKYPNSYMGLMSGMGSWQRLDACCPPAEALLTLCKKGKMGMPDCNSWRMSRRA